MSINQIIGYVTDKANFKNLGAYSRFCDMYLDFIQDNLQAVIVSQNENQYRFYQYNEQANFQITRPINANLMYDATTFEYAFRDFISLLANLHERNSVKEIKGAGETINRTVYTIQQSIGAALDALPSGRSNTARKLNGDLFEKLIRLIIKEIGVDCEAGVMQVPVVIVSCRLRSRSSSR